MHLTIPPSMMVMIVLFDIVVFYSLFKAVLREDKWISTGWLFGSILGVGATGLWISIRAGVWAFIALLFVIVVADRIAKHSALHR